VVNNIACQINTLDKNKRLNSTYSSDLSLENRHFDSAYTSTDKPHSINISSQANGINYSRTSRCRRYCCPRWRDSSHDCYWRLHRHSTGKGISIKMYSFTNIHAPVFQGCCLIPVIVKCYRNRKAYRKHQCKNEKNSTELAKLSREQC